MFNNTLKNSLGNVDRNEADLVNEAATKSGLNVWTEDNATDIHGRPLPYLVAVYTSEKCDMGEFWRILRELKNANLA